MKQPKKKSIPLSTREKKKITTIKLNQETKARLDKLKVNDRESYDSLLNKLMNLLNIFRKNPELGAKILGNIERAIEFKKIYNKKEDKSRKDKF